MAVQRELDDGEDPSIILVKINNMRKKQLPAVLSKKNLVDFDKYKVEILARY